MIIKMLISREENHESFHFLGKGRSQSFLGQPKDFPQKEIVVAFKNLVLTDVIFCLLGRNKAAQAA